MDYDCHVEFNVPTNLRDDKGFSQKMRENEEAYRYVTDYRPLTMCMMKGVPLQGQQVGTRGPPINALDVEWALRTEGLRQETNEYIVDPSADAETPEIFKRKLLIPQCSDVLVSEKTRTRRSERPRTAPPTTITSTDTQRKNTDYMRPGLDTRRQIKDLFTQYEKEKAKNSNFYGVSKYDSRPLVPGTNPTCTTNDASLDCMHVYSPDAKHNGKIIDPTVPYGVAAAALDSQSNVAQPVPLSTRESAQGLTENWMDAYSTGL